MTCLPGEALSSAEGSFSVMNGPPDVMSGPFPSSGDFFCQPIICIYLVCYRFIQNPRHFCVFEYLPRQTGCAEWKLISYKPVKYGLSLLKIYPVFP